MDQDIKDFYEQMNTTAGGIVGGLILAILIYYFGIKS